MKRAIGIAPDGHLWPIMIQDRPPSELSILRATIGAYPTRIDHDVPNLTAFFSDEEDTGQPTNNLATALFGKHYLIWGTVVVMGSVNKDGDTLGLTPEQVNIFLSDTDNLLNDLIEANRATR